MNTQTRENQLRAQAAPHAEVIRKCRVKDPTDPNFGKYQVFARLAGKPDALLLDGAWLTLDALSLHYINLDLAAECAADDAGLLALKAVWDVVSEGARRKFLDHVTGEDTREKQARVQTYYRFSAVWDNAGKLARERLLRFLNDGVDLGPDDTTWAPFLAEWDGHPPAQRAELRDAINRTATMEQQAA